MTRLAAALSALTLSHAACGSTNPPATGPSSVAKAAAGDLTVELLTDKALGTGLTPIYLRVSTASGAAVTDATVTFEPLMTMPTMSHSCPVMGAPTLTADGLYATAAVFQMASGPMGDWSATVGVTRPAGALKVATFANLVVSDTGRAKTFTSGMSKFVVSLSFQPAPAVGLNPIVVTVHETTDMGMTFAPVNNATIKLDPQMPSMGHGSVGSVDPVKVSDGRYEGKLAFSMAGTWVTTLTLARPSVDPLGSVAITTTF
jgi:YtkA-like